MIADQPDRFRVVGLAAGGVGSSCWPGRPSTSTWQAVAITDEDRVHDLNAAFRAEANRRGGLGGPWPDLPGRAGGPRRDERHRRSALRRRAQRDHRLGRAASRPWPRWPAGRMLALANKESLVIGGALVTRRGRAGPDRAPSTPSTRRSPSACAVGRPREVDRLILTASGGPFRGRTREQMRDVTPAQALAHPTWDMGRVDHHQLRDPGQQGSGAARGAPAVRRRPRPDRRRRPPAVDRALDGAVRGRVDAGPVLAAGHEAADRARSGLAGADARCGAALRLVDARRPGPSSRWTTRRFPRSSWPGGPGGWRHRAGCLQRRQRGRRSRPSTTGELGFLGIVDVVEAVLDEHRAGATRTGDVRSMLVVGRRAHPGARAGGRRLGAASSARRRWSCRDTRRGSTRARWST